MTEERIKELRSRNRLSGLRTTSNDVVECLDEIERLRKALEEIAKINDGVGGYYTDAMGKIARRALGGKP